MRNGRSKRDVAAVSLLTMVSIFVQIGLAPPGQATMSNDDLADAMTISSLPFDYQEDVGQATSESTEPVTDCNDYVHTVWFRFSPSVDTGLLLNTSGSRAESTAISFYALDGEGLAHEEACDKVPSAGSDGSFAKMFVGAKGGVKYLIKVSHARTAVITTGGVRYDPAILNFHAEANSWVNDDFADATTVESPLFIGRGYNNTFTEELGEPQPSCVGVDTMRTAWFRFTPSDGMGALIDTYASNFYGVLAAYTGTSLADLTEVECFPYQNEGVRWRPKTGTTYYLQLSARNWCCTTKYGGYVLKIRQSQIPSNDDFTSPKLVDSIPFSEALDTTLATGENLEPKGCRYQSAQYSIWYRLLPAESSLFKVDVSRSEADVGVNVYTGSQLQSLATERCGDRALVLNARAGAEYFIQINGLSPWPPNGTLPYGSVAIDITAVVAPPGDSYSGAIEVPSLPFSHVNNLFQASVESVDPVDRRTASTIWYRFTPNTDSGVEVTIESGDPAFFSIWTGTASEVPSALQSELIQYEPTSFRARAGVTYNFLVSADWRTLKQRSFTLAARATDRWPNRIPSEARPLGFASPQQDSSYRHPQGQAQPIPSCSRSSGHALWYKISSPHDTGVLVDTQGSSYPTTVSAYVGEPGALQEVACSPTTKLSFKASANSTYYIRAAGTSCGGGCYHWGNLMIRATEALVPGNDQRASSEIVDSLPFSRSPNVYGATTDNDDPPASCGPLGQTVWYSFAPSTDFGVRASVTEETYHFLPRVATFIKEGSTFREIGCGSRFSFRARKGQQYFFAVGGVSGRGLKPTFSLESVGYPANDDFKDAIAIVGSEWIDTQMNEAAGLEPGEIPYCSDGSSFAWAGSTFWYRLHTPLPGPVILRTDGSNFDTVISVFTGDAVDSLKQVSCNNDSPLNAKSASTQFLAEGGETYYVRVAGNSLETGSGRIRMQVPTKALPLP